MIEFGEYVGEPPDSGDELLVSVEMLQRERLLKEKQEWSERDKGNGRQKVSVLK